MDDQVKTAQDMIKQVFDESQAEINGRKYDFAKFVHAERRKVFAFASTVQYQLAAGDFSFLEAPAYAPVEKMMFDKILFEGGQLSKRPNHFEDYPEDYIMLVTTALQVISYPFMRGNPTV